MVQSMRADAAGLGGAALLSLLMMWYVGPAHADVALNGTFTATQTCPAYQSIRKSTNPEDVSVEANKSYDILAKNKPDETHYRIVVEGAQPAERWVSSSCGRVDTTGQQVGGAAKSAAPAGAPAAAAANKSGVRATHVLSMSWEPAFCAQHGDKSECRVLTSTSYAGTHLSLHGLWPQPRGTQYCNVPAEVSQIDRNHDWNGLPEPDISADTLKRLSAVMPGVQSKLQRHEWIVHGTCFGGTADAYFARAAGLSEAVNASKVPQLFSDKAGQSLSADDIRAAFDEAFGAGAGARVTVSCQGRGADRKITELIINLAGDVKGSAPLGDLMRAAQALTPGCPSGSVVRAPL